MPQGRILDSSALHDFARGREYARARVAVALRSPEARLSVPAAALGEALGRLPLAGREQLHRLLSQNGVVLDELNLETTRRVGQLLANARSHTPDLDLVTGHVAFVARVRLWPVLTSSPQTLLRFDAALDVDTLP